MKKKSFVIVRIFGGLGNQLWQYAFARNLSIQLNKPLILDISFYKHPLIDLPEVCKLVKTYTSKFPQLKGKVKTVSCKSFPTKSFGELDLAIAINSVNECTRDTQLKYFSKVIQKSKLSYIVRNPDTQERINDHKITINSLGDNFLVDDSGRLEQSYSSQIIVYIKREN